MPIDLTGLGVAIVAIALIALAAVLGRLAARFFLRASTDRAGRR